MKNRRWISGLARGWACALALLAGAGAAGIAAEEEDATGAPAGETVKDANGNAIPKLFFEFSGELVKALNSGNTAFLESCFDKVAFADRFGNVPGYPTGHYRKKFYKYLNDLKIANLLTESSEWLGRGNAVLRGCYRENDGVRAVVRMDDGKGGYRWLEFTLFTRVDSKAKEKDKVYLISGLYIGDLYSSGMGTNLSEILRVDFSPAVINEAPKTRAKAMLDAAAFDGYLKNMMALVAFRNALRDGNPSAALAAYEKAPEGVRKKVWVQLAALRAAQAAGQDAAATGKLREQVLADNLNDLAVGYAQRDYLLAQKRFADYRQLLKTIGERFGVDAGQYMEMAASCKAEGKLAEAQEYYQKARELEPQMEAAYDAEAAYYLGQNDFPALKDLYTQYHKAFPDKDLSAYLRGKGEKYEDFLISTEYLDLTTMLREEQKKKEEQAKAEEEAKAKDKKGKKKTAGTGTSKEGEKKGAAK